MERDDEFEIYIGEHLDRLIKEAGLTPTELAARSGVAYSTIMGLINEHKPITVKTGKRLAKGLGTNLGVVLGEKLARPLSSGRISAAGEIVSDTHTVALPAFFTAETTIPGLAAAGALVKVIPSDWRAGRWLAVRYPDQKVRLRYAFEADGSRWLRDEHGDEIKVRQTHEMIGRVAQVVHDHEDSPE